MADAVVAEMGGPGVRLARSEITSLWCVMTLVSASSAILTRYCGVPASSVGFWRVAGAACVLMPWWVLAVRQYRPRPVASWGAGLTGVFLGVHFATWAWALLNAKVANAAIFIAMQPAITPLVGRWLAGDRLNAREYLGTLLACIGMGWILGGQILYTRDQIPGSAVALLSMICCAVYFVLGRKYRSREHVILFSVPVYLAAAAVQAVGALLIDGKIGYGHSARTWMAIAGMILVPTVAGHTMAMYLLRHVKAHTIVLSIPVQFILIAIAGIMVFGEWPKVWFYPGAGIVIAGVVMAIVASTRKQASGRV